jgi:hypothetical protein
VQHARDLEQVKRTALQSFQAQGGMAIARPFERFEQGRNAGAIDVGDFSQIYDKSLRRLTSQHRKKPVTQGRRGIDAQAAFQAQNVILSAIFHNDFQVGRIGHAALQQNPPIRSWHVGFHPNAQAPVRPMSLRDNGLTVIRGEIADCLMVSRDKRANQLARDRALSGSGLLIHVSEKIAVRVAQPTAPQGNSWRDFSKAVTAIF